MSSIPRLLFQKILFILPHKPSECGISFSVFRRQFSSSHRITTKYRHNPVIMKLDSEEFKSIFTEEVQTLAKVFEKYNYEIRIAGGAVRDLLLGKKPKDLDFATVATPDEMKEMFTKEEIRMVNPNGESHGTVTPRINNKENFEVTTLRIDVQTDGRHAKVEFTKDWLLDAHRRDLTINSMFLGLDGTVYDYFHGYDDLQKRRVVFVGQAQDRIREDYLRILRFFRFFGRISTEPDSYDQGTIETIKANASGLKKVSGERILNELRLILSGNFGPLIFEKMLSIDLGPYMGFPQQPNMLELRAVIERTRDLKPHCLCYVAAVLNDMEEAVTLNDRLKMSIFERELTFFIVEHRFDKICEKPLLPYQKLILNTIFKVADIQEWVKELFLYKGRPDLAQEIKNWDVPKLPLTGNDLKECFPDPKYTKIVLMKLKDYWADNDYIPDKQQLLSMVPRILENIKPEDFVRKAKNQTKRKSSIH